ncbi:MAG: hypothetical protein EOL95_02400 [Bacteroidia bacterium]|nr:hypothetical protein [Bacteroidia bacterium]
MRKFLFLIIIPLFALFTSCNDTNTGEPAEKLGKDEPTPTNSTFTHLPIIRIVIDGGGNVSSNKSVYRDMTAEFDPNGIISCDTTIVKGQIRGRGNSTWAMPKRPYKIKLDEKAGIFGLKPAKKWVLLANYADKTLMRNYLAFEMSEKVNMDYTPQHLFVELFINGVHQGNYLLTDQLEIGNGRLEAVNLLEIDQRIYETQNKPWFQTSHFPIVIEAPTEINQTEQYQISEYFKNAERVLDSNNYKDPKKGFRQYFDTKSVIKWWLINELFKNVDARVYSSIYFHQRLTSEKVFMGPVWDFDLGAGNSGHSEGCQKSSGWYVLYNAYIYRMYTDPDFKQETKDAWNIYKNVFMDVIMSIDSIQDYLQYSQEENFKIWPIFNDNDWYSVKNLPDNYEGQVEFLKNYLLDRFDWMDSQINQ